MLHWLAGQKQPEGPTDPDATGYVDPPETPAPVFAVRAFKHAIFGTPQTTQPKQRRNSTTDNGRPRNGDLRPSRPGMARPKSSNDAQLLSRQQQFADMPEPMSSPTKGILLTPGTAAAKKKNVTFGDHVLDNEGKRPIKNGLSDDGPNKTPNIDSGLGDGSEDEDDAPERNRSRTKLTETLEQVRDEARKKRSKSDQRTKRLLEDDVDVPSEFVDPKSEAGKYWKREYDAYRANTRREVKKLITKQKAAKGFAHTMDEECSNLKAELRIERKKVEALETQMQDFTTLMKDLSEQLMASKKEAQERTEEIERLQRQPSRKDSTRPESDDYGALLPLESITSAQRSDKEMMKAEADPVQRPSEPYQPTMETEKRKMDLQALRARVKSKPESKPTRQTDDIWAHSFGSSSPIATRSSGRPQSASAAVKVVKAIDNPSHVKPLQTLDVNALGSGRDGEQDARPESTIEEPGSPLDRQRARAKSSATHEGDSDPSPPKPPVHASIPKRPVSADSKYTSAESAINDNKTEDDWSLPIPTFSPLPPDTQPRSTATTARRTTAPSVAATSASREAPAVKPARPSISTKENISPTLATSSKSPTPSRDLNTKPSALWSSMNAPPAGQRAGGTTTRMSREVRELSGERLEAAKARIQARKVVS